jgi:beta-glucanase (GH16 family)
MESKDDENQLIQTIYGTEGSKNREDSTGQAN